MQRCLKCGGDNSSVDRFCGDCGAALDPQQGLNDALVPDLPAELRWETKVPLATDRFMLYDIGKVLFFSSLGIVVFGSILALILGGADAPPEEWLTGLSIVLLVFGGIGAGLLLVMLIFFGNQFPVRITMGPQGVHWEALSRRGKWANRGAIVAGLLAGKPGVAGAGLLAESRRTESMRWRDIQRVRCHPELCVVSLMNGWRVVLRLHCPPTLYREVCSMIRANAPEARIEGGAA